MADYINQDSKVFELEHEDDYFFVAFRGDYFEITVQEGGAISRCTVYNDEMWELWVWLTGVIMAKRIEAHLTADLLNMKARQKKMKTEAEVIADHEGAEAEVELMTELPQRILKMESKIDSLSKTVHDLSIATGSKTKEESD